MRFIFPPTCCMTASSWRKARSKVGHELQVLELRRGFRATGIRVKSWRTSGVEHDCEIMAELFVSILAMSTAR